MLTFANTANGDFSYYILPPYLKMLL